MADSGSGTGNVYGKHVIFHQIKKYLSKKRSCGGGGGRKEAFKNYSESCKRTQEATVRSFHWPEVGKFGH